MTKGERSWRCRLNEQVKGMKNVLIVIWAIAALAGCKADELEIGIDEAEIRDAVGVGSPAVTFEATFSNNGELSLTDNDRAQFEAIEKIIKQFIVLDDFEIELSDRGYDVVLNGIIPMTKYPDEPSAYFVFVSPSELFEGALRVELRTGTQFAKMVREIRDVNPMLAPDAYHPTLFQLKANGAEVIAPTVQVDGRYHLMWRGVVQHRLRMTFSGGAYDEIGAGFFLRLPWR